jgi:hypothetical protein
MFRAMFFLAFLASFSVYSLDITNFAGTRRSVAGLGGYWSSSETQMNDALVYTYWFPEIKVKLLIQQTTVANPLVTALNSMSLDSLSLIRISCDMPPIVDPDSKGYVLYIIYANEQTGTIQRPFKGCWINAIEQK